VGLLGFYSKNKKEHHSNPSIPGHESPDHQKGLEKSFGFSGKCLDLGL
jgi:hypothetical protein